MLAIVNAAAFWRGRRGAIPALVFGGVSCAYLFCVGIPVVMLNAILLGIVVAAWWVFGKRPRWFLASSLGATLVAYGIVGWFIGVAEVREWEQLKAAYPMESLAGRLAYEHRRRQDADPAAHDPDRLALVDAAFKEKSGWWPRRRVSALERLHAGAVEQFVNSPGFGVARMRLQPSPSTLRATDEPGEALPQRSRPYVPPEPGPVDVMAAEPDFTKAHIDNMLTFLDPQSFGYVCDRDHVAGFQPHQFRREPDAPQRWQIERLELVSLLKHDQPVVYLSENLPRMDELRKAATRPLDAFEQQALAALRRGEDLTAQDGSERMRMFGSLRAAQQCVRCHDVERGDLLGAFSYQLIRQDVKD
jgi:hypothetical protein